MKKLVCILLLIPCMLLGKSSYYDKISHKRFIYSEEREEFSENQINFYELTSDRERAIFLSGCVFSLDQIIMEMILRESHK